MAQLPDLRYTAREFESIVAALQSYVQATRPEFWTDFFESNLGQALIEIVAYTGDVLSFSIDQVSREAFLATLRRYSSAIRFANSVGYLPSGAAPASVDVFVDPLPGTSQVALSDDLFIAEGAQVTVGDISYEVPADYSFASGTVKSSVTFTLTEGEAQVESFSGSGGANQAIASTLTGVADGSWSITVNGLDWVETTNLLLHGAEDVFRVEYNASTGITVYFGDGVNGNVPPDASLIELSFRTTMGSAGQITGDALTGKKIAATFGTSPAVGVSITLDNPTASTGGVDRETLAEIKANLPAWMRAVDKAVTIADYNVLSVTFSDPTYGSIGKAFAVRRDWGTGPTFISTLDLFSDLPDGSGGNPYDPTGSYYVIRDLDALAPGGPGIYRYNGATFDFVSMPALLANNIIDVFVWAPSGTSYAAASAGLKAALLAYLEARAEATVHVLVLDGTTTPVPVTLGTVTVDALFDLAEVESNVTAALQAYFQNTDHQPGSTIYVSQLYDTVMNVDGVDHFVMTAPASDVTSLPDELLILGTITATFVQAT